MLRSSARTALLPLVYLVALAAFAQPDKPKTKVVLQRDRIAAQWDTVNCVKNVLKANPLLFFRGEVPLYYERALSSRLSAEVGLGITYRNYINLTFAGDHPDADDFGAGTKIKSYPSIRVGFRYYLVPDLEPQGSYLHLEFAYLHYGKEITEKDSLGQLSERTNLDERIYNDFRLYYGHQVLSGSSNWLYDFYAGVGLRSRAMTIVQETFNPTTDQWTYEVDQVNDVVPAFFLGVKVGLGW